MNRYLYPILIVMICFGLFLALYDPAPKVSPLPPVVVVEPPFLPPAFKAKVRHPDRAIFCETLLGKGCWYDDKDLMKVGPKGIKHYEWTDVVPGDEP